MAPERDVNHEEESKISLAFLADWALDYLLSENPPESKIEALIHAVHCRKIRKAKRELSKGNFKPAMRVINNEAEERIEHVALGNILADVWFNREYDMEGSPAQQKAMFFYGLSQLLKRKERLEKARKDQLTQNDILITQIERIQEYQISSTPLFQNMTESEALTFLNGLRRKF